MISRFRHRLVRAGTGEVLAEGPDVAAITAAKRLFGPAGLWIETL